MQSVSRKANAVLRPLASRALSTQSSVDPSEYGSKVFVGAVADKYLKKQGESAAILDDPKWPVTKADKVAAALLEWGKDSNATTITHWFQPLGSTMVRHGMSAQVHNNMFTFTKDAKPVYSFSGSALIRGESDGSSFPSGGIRATHTAGGYTVLDSSSPIFMRGDTIFVPTIFVSWTGHAIDEKTPLLRSMDALNKEGKRLMKALGYNVPGVVPNIGLEQEFFLVPRDAFARRLDLQLTGRTIMGKMPPRGQEMCDHYMAPLNQHALLAMKEIQDECFLLGIPLRTRHREVAPNQYEFAPMFGVATSQVDQNLMVMQISDEVCAKYNLACLMHEKPFMGVNGSGKHNNWSLGTTDGINLLNAGQVTKASGNPIVFPTIVAAIVDAVDKYGDLMRCAIASPGNDFRLGACEAPPAILSTYLGEDLTKFLEEFKAGKVGEYKAAKKMLSVGVEGVAPFEVPSEDRNRTSPFPYGGHRFEFRAVGSSQNVSFVNTVLNSITADAFSRFSAAIEGGKKPQDVASEALNASWKTVFNGNGYSLEWRAEAEKRGVWRIDSGVEAMNRLSVEKNIKLFEGLGVLSKVETEARRVIMLGHYVGTVEMEANCMVEMIVQSIIPAVKEADQDTAALAAAAKAVADKLAKVHHEEDPFKKASVARELRLDTMEAARKVCDEAEAICPANLWPMATYKDLLFLDANQDGHGQTI